MIKIKKLIIISIILSFVTSAYAKDFNIGNIFSISIPECMELPSGTYKIINDAIKENLAPTLLSSNRIVFQQKGLNDFDKGAQSTYARIIINYFFDEELNGIGPKFGPFDVTKSDIEDMDTMLKAAVFQDAKSSGNTILNYTKTELHQEKDYSFFQLSYTRVSANKKPVYIEQYIIYAKSHFIRITISARESEKDSLFKELWNIKHNLFF